MTSSSVTPRYRACGDDWFFSLAFVQADGTTPFDLDGWTITADLYVRYRQSFVSRLLVGSGLTLVSAGGGLAELIVPADLTDPSVTPPDDPSRPDPFGLAVYPTRVVIGIGQGGLRRTLDAILICPFLPGSVQTLPSDDESPIVITVPAWPSAIGGTEIGGSLDLNIPGNFAF